MNHKVAAKRLNILITAHEVSPILGSECGAAWNLIIRLAKYNDLTVLYAKTNQFGTNNYEAHIADYIKKEPVDGVKFVAIEQPKMTCLFVRLNKFISHQKSNVGNSILYFLGVKYWEKSVFKHSQSLVSDYEYDIVHHLNHISFREPGYLWLLGKPFFWGPVSGLVKVPIKFISFLQLGLVIKFQIRNIFGAFQSTFNSRVLKATKAANCLYYVSHEDAHYFNNKTNNGKYLLDVGTYSSSTDLKIRGSINKFKILWVGRLDHLKALNLLLKALVDSTEFANTVELTIVGDGPQDIHYKRMALKLGLRNIVWLGEVEKHKVSVLMSESDVLVHTSIKEATSAAVLEALSVGLPVICHDAFGLSYVVNSSCGIKIPLYSPLVSINELNKAISFLTNNSNRLEQLRHGAKKRSKLLTWDAMAEEISNDYLMALHGNRDIDNKKI
jgi:glycosyltransferase involved in cell wall biosynthesis